MRGVFRVLRWRRGSLAALRGRAREANARAWVAARSVDRLRDLRRDGLRSQLLGRRPHLPDAPGLPAGGAGRWTVYRTVVPARPGPVPEVGSWTYDELRGHLSPRLLALALERSFRNDSLLVVRREERLLGIVWSACAARRATVAGGRNVTGEPVYYQPIAEPGASVEELIGALAQLDDARGGAMVVTPGRRLPPTLVNDVGTFDADLRFHAGSWLGALHRREHALDVAVP